tara:strand:- start:4698 stop:5222 length:525 start_codon:yes stop_codon:yes gene_type:complete
MKLKCKLCGKKNVKGATHYCKVDRKSRTVDDDDDGFIESTFWGFVTDSWMLGWAFGGNPIGAALGDALNCADQAYEDATVSSEPQLCFVGDTLTERVLPELPSTQDVLDKMADTPVEEERSTIVPLPQLEPVYEAPTPPPAPPRIYEPEPTHESPSYDSGGYDSGCDSGGCDFD